MTHCQETWFWLCSFAIWNHYGLRVSIQLTLIDNDIKYNSFSCQRKLLLTNLIIIKEFIHHFLNIIISSSYIFVMYGRSYPIRNLNHPNHQFYRSNHRDRHPDPSNFVDFPWQIYRDPYQPGHVLELVLYSRSRQNFPNIPIFLNDSFLLSSTRRGERKECETVSRNSFQQEAYLATNFIILSFYAGLFDDRNRVISMRDLYLLSTFLNIFSFIRTSFRSCKIGCLCLDNYMKNIYFRVYIILHFIFWHIATL